MKVKRWQRKIWWLARYFELAVPMAFAFYVVLSMVLVGHRKAMLGIVWSVIGLAYMAALREIVEATWSWQAMEWLMSINHHLTDDEAVQLKMRAEKPKLKVCRVYLLIPAMLVVVSAFLRIPIWSMVARIVVAVVVGSLVLSHLLMVRVQIMQTYSEMTKIGRSS